MNLRLCRPSLHNLALSSPSASLQRVLVDERGEWPASFSGGEDSQKGSNRDGGAEKEDCVRNQRR